MLTTTSRAILIAAIAIAAIVAVGSLGKSPPTNGGQPTNAENRDRQHGNAPVQNADAQHRNEGNNKGEWYDTFRERPTDWLLVLFNGLLVFATVALFVTGEKSAQAAKNSADIAHEALVKAQRAFVTTGGFPWLWRPYLSKQPGVFYDISPTFINVGETPAVDPVIITNSALRDSKLPDNFDFPYTGAPKSTILGPKQSIAATGISITDQDLLAVQQGKKFFYLWGTITYRDVFDGTPVHRTDFATNIAAVNGDPLKPADPTNPKGTTVEIHFGVMERHNRTD